jgi:hypothetical protein
MLEAGPFNGSLTALSLVEKGRLEAVSKKRD